ncbi:MAG: AraC family transcriptional regulator [Chthoniobacteraceae bacterium]|nr:AraC family transcriptional regulator [Chthoniobacteraceae bacterium]
MPDSPTWSAFQARQLTAPPLRFVQGMRNSVASDFRCPMHAHELIEIVYHPTGEGVTHTEGRGGLAFRQGSAVIYPPHHPHDQVMESGGEDFCVQIALPDTDGAVPKTWLYVPHVDLPCVREDLRFLSWGRTRLTAVEQATHNLRATALLLELIRIAALRREHQAADPAERYVLHAEQILQENFATIESLPAVAARAGVSYDYLRHAFKARRGITLIRHLNEVRVERAKVLLKLSGLPLKQVAAMCGFKDEYYFSAVFRRHTHATPGGYREAGE